MDIILKDFHRKVQRTSLVKERAERASDLQKYLREKAKYILEQQITIHKISSVNKLQKELNNLYSKYPTPTGDLLDHLIRKSSFELQTALSDLETSSLILNDEVRQLFVKDLETVVRGFTKTPAYEAISLRRNEGTVSKSQKKKKRGKFFSLPLPIVKTSIQIVGMFRPPGYGNLQGFAGLKSAAFGLPLDLLLGFQNDGDSFELNNEDKENPLLRLQPKFNFDVEL
jgi:hypothetical protein